jgi:phosphoglycerate dehydrogenase-like enzyme
LVKRLSDNDIRLVTNTGKGIISEDKLIEEVREADAVLAGGERYSEKVLDSAPKLKVIARTGVGYDQIDVPAATKRGIYVTYAPIPELASSVAEHTMALILASSKRICYFNSAIRAGYWERSAWLEGIEDLYHLTLGLLGAGRVGREVAKRARAFGMNVIYYDKIRNAELERDLNVGYVSLEQLLTDSDILSIHTPLTPETRGIINRDTLRKMKSNALIVNTARGKIIDEPSLAEALREHRLRGACLDVLDVEPPTEGHAFYKLGEELPNLILTPHLGHGWYTVNAVMEAAVEDVIRVLSGRLPRYPLNEGLSLKKQETRAAKSL